MWSFDGCPQLYLLGFGAVLNKVTWPLVRKWGTLSSHELSVRLVGMLAHVLLIHLYLSCSLMYVTSTSLPKHFIIFKCCCVCRHFNNFEILVVSKHFFLFLVLFDIEQFVEVHLIVCYMYYVFHYTTFMMVGPKCALILRHYISTRINGKLRYVLT